MRRAPRRRSRASRRTRRSLALVFALVFGPALSRPARAVCLEWSSPPAIGTADRVFAVAVADLDRDGDLDALSADHDGDRIAWFENLAGDGSTWTVRTIGEGLDGVTSLALGDLDGDGDLDALSTSELDATLAWHEHLPPGDGSTWTTHEIVTNATSAQSAVAVDVDRDGDLDIVVASGATARIGWRENDGSGGGWTLHTVTSANVSARSLAAFDVDRDGDADLAAIFSSSNLVAWYENDNGGGWARTTVFATTGDVGRGIAAADVDGDGDLDALSSWTGTDVIRWHENDGDGAAWILHTVSLVDDGPYAIAGADLDLDGDADVLASSFVDDSVRWHENRGAGAAWSAHLISTTTNGPRAVAAGDLDGDGDLDALSASTVVDSADWFRNDRLHGEALFAPKSTIATLAAGLGSLVAVDLDRDGDLDALASALNDTIEWYENSALDGGGSTWSRHAVTTEADGAYSAVDADLDGDGDPDLLTASYTSGVVWYVNTADDASTWSAVGIRTGPHSANDVVAADLDRDGDLDAISSWGLPGSVIWHRNLEGDGTDWSSHVVATALGYAFGVVAADLDGDGDLDLVTADATLNAIVWYEADETPDVGTWTARTISTAVDSPRSLAVADLDRDGDLDVLSASQYDDTIAWYESDGSPQVDPASSWTARPISTSALNAKSVATADLDGDGDLDVVATAFSLTAAVHWYENDGSPATGPWSFGTLSTTFAGGYHATPADLDGDGDFDVLAVGNPASGLAWIPNLGTKVHDDGFDSDANTACWSSAVP